MTNTVGKSIKLEAIGGEIVKANLTNNISPLSAYDVQYNEHKINVICCNEEIVAECVSCEEEHRIDALEDVSKSTADIVACSFFEEKCDNSVIGVAHAEPQSLSTQNVYDIHSHDR